MMLFSPIVWVSKQGRDRSKPSAVESRSLRILTCNLRIDRASGLIDIGSVRNGIPLQSSSQRNFVGAPYSSTLETTRFIKNFPRKNPWLNPCYLFLWLNGLFDKLPFLRKLLIRDWVNWKEIPSRFSRSTVPLWSFNCEPSGMQSTRVQRKWKWWLRRAYFVSRSLERSHGVPGSCTLSQEI